MAFEIKPFAQILDAMIQHMRGTTDKVSDYNVGSVVRTLLEAPALELDEFYQALYYALLQAIPTAIYRGFGFELLPASAAGGLVEFRLYEVSPDDITIPSGARFVGPNGVYYETVEDGIIPAGHLSVSVRVVAQEVGSIGNADPHTLDPVGGIPGDMQIDNSLITGGAEQESEDERAQRFAAFIASLSRGTVAALQYAARIPYVSDVSGLVTERVERVSITEEPGHVFCYIYNGKGGTSQALVDAVQLLIDGYRDPETLEWVAGYRPAGMRVEVVAMDEVAVDVEIEVDVPEIQRTQAMVAAIEGAVGRAIMSALPSSELRPIQLVNAALTVTGVNGAIVLSPTSAIPVGLSRVLVPGEVTVTWKP